MKPCDSCTSAIPGCHRSGCGELRRWEEKHAKTDTPSAVLSGLIAEFHAREALGLVKYGTTLDRTDLTCRQILQHAKEEAMDLAMYLQSVLDSLA